MLIADDGRMIFLDTPGAPAAAADGNANNE